MEHKMNKKFPMKKADVLEKAKELITGDRQQKYGDPKVNFKRIIDGWQLILGHEVTQAQLVQMMVWTKIARLQEDPKHMDSWVDIAGYAACGGEVVDND